MIWTKTNGIWEPCIPASKDSGSWKEVLDFEKKDDYWNTKIEIYPSPFAPILNPASVTEPEFEGTATYLHTSSYYSHLPSSMYTDSVSGISSVAFKVSVYDGVKYNETFVYKCGITHAPSPWVYNPYSVYGGGSNLGIYSLIPWNISANVQFNHVGFGISDKTKIKIDYTKATVTSVDIGPYSKNKQYSILSTSSFEIYDVDLYDKLYITVNNDLSTPLMVFADPLSKPVPNGAIYIKPGILNASTLNNILYGKNNYRLDVSANNLTFYLAPGAYFHGRFGLQNVSGVKFMGKGIIDAHRENDWWANWSYLNSNIRDEDKLIYSPFMAFSSYAEAYIELDKSYHHTVEDLTIVNHFIYLNTAGIKSVDNCKSIGQFVNTDGWRVSDWKSSDPNKYASLTRSFIFAGDDTFFPGESESNILISGNYSINIAGTVFRTYYPQYNSPSYNYGFSAINNDVRTYSAGSYQMLTTKPYTGYKHCVFGLLSQVEKNRPYDPTNSYILNNFLFSSIRIEGYTDVPIFNLGIEPSPGANSPYQENYGSMSSITFADITASTHPNSIFNMSLSNSIFASEETYRPSNIIFKNVKINDKILTNNNKNDYFFWTQKPFLIENNSTIWGQNVLASVFGSSIADLYFIIGDSIADGFSGLASELTNTVYSSIGNPVGVSSNVVSGAYIFQINPNFTNPNETGFPKFSLIRPGINTINIDYNSASRPSNGDMGIESILAYKLKQNSGNRDIYILKMTRPNSLALSAQYEYDPGPNQSWSISANQIYKDFITSAVSACKVLKNQYKNIDFKGGVIFLSNNLPSNLTNTSSYIFSDLSGLVNGIRSVFFSSTGPNLDTFYSNIVWVGPLWEGGTNNYYNYFSSQLQTMDSNEIRFKYYPQIRGNEYSDNNYGITHPFPKTPGYIKMAEDIYEIFKDMNKSVTNPDTVLGVNINFYSH